MAWTQVRVLQVLSRYEPFRPTAFLNGSVPFKSLMQIIVDDEAHGHHMLVVNLGNHVDELGLQLGQRSEQVFKRIGVLAGFRLIDDLVGEIDVALDQVHVIDKLLELGWNCFATSATLRRLAACRFVGGLLLGSWLVASAVLLFALGALLDWHVRELNASLDKSLVDLREVW